MFRAWFFILLVCCAKVGKAETDQTARLYNELKLEEVVSLPAFRQALAGYETYGSDDNPLLALIDFTKPSTEQRFCVVNLEEKQLLFASHVAHGRNSGGNYATSFSNRPGSYKSSLGFFRTGTTYYGKNGYSLLLDGLEKGVNDKARERAIVMHGAPYADPVVLQHQDRLGRSLGCPALPPDVSRQVIDAIKEGTLLYIYGNDRDIAGK